jgi:hypothetical protein
MSSRTAVVAQRLGNPEGEKGVLVDTMIIVSGRSGEAPFVPACASYSGIESLCGNRLPPFS